MQNKFAYEYAVIRLVPRVEREEFINIGVILFCKRKKFLNMKFLLDERRMRSLCEDVDIQLVYEYLRAWEKVCVGGKVGGKIGEQDRAFRFRWLTAYRSTILQTSRVHPGLCSQPALMLEDLFEMYVL